ncbi:MAG: hypothetical protein PVH68_04720 [Armatimonadota bacterium]|jgi:hypothetical protein
MSGVIHTGSTARAKSQLGRAFWEFQPSRLSLIADRVLVPYGKGRKEGTIDVVTREDLLRDEGTKMAAGATYKRGHMRFESQLYDCEKYGFEVPNALEKIKEYEDSLDLELAGTRKCRLAIGIDIEREVSALVFNTSTWTGSDLYTDTSGVWSAAATDIIGDVVAAAEKVRQNTGMEPNALILNKVNLNYMLTNTGIKGQFNADIVTRAMIEQALPSLFGLEELIVAGGVYNSAGENQSFSASEMWSSSYAMVALVAGSGDDTEVPCVGRTIRWDGISGEGVDVSTYWENQTKSYVVQADTWEDHKVFDKYFGHLLKVD